MGLLDELLGSMLAQGQNPGQGQIPPQAQAPTQGQLNRDQLSQLAQAAIALLNDPRIGGLDGLLRRFQQAGLGDVVSSWVGTGQNQPIDPTQLQRTMPDEVTEVSRQAGVPPQQGGSLLAILLPQLIDRLTPQGRVPQQDQMSQLGSQLLQSLLR